MMIYVIQVSKALTSRNAGIRHSKPSNVPFIISSSDIYATMYVRAAIEEARSNSARRLSCLSELTTATVAQNCKRMNSRA